MRTRRTQTHSGEHRSSSSLLLILSTTCFLLLSFSIPTNSEIITLTSDTFSDKVRYLGFMFDCNFIYPLLLILLNFISFVDKGERYCMVCQILCSMVQTLVIHCCSTFLLFYFRGLIVVSFNHISDFRSGNEILTVCRI